MRFIDMRFIDPKTDFAFKKIFGSDQSHPILISFINHMVYSGEPIVVDLEILNPYQAPSIAGMKATYLDVRAKLNTGDLVIIEMQVLNVAGFEKRVLYNATKAYATQLDLGAHYTTLTPVIALTITDFEMFSEFDDVRSSFILKERTNWVDYPAGDLELIFIELPKFRKTIEDLTSVTDQWLYFLKHAPSLEAVPSKMETEPALQQAFQIAQKANLNRDELEELEKQHIYIQDQRGAITKALEMGLEQGREEEKIEIARKLLAVLDNETIATTTGLSIEVIQGLRSV